MAENRLSNMKGLPQAKRRRECSDHDNSATSLLTRVPDSYVSPFLPSESEFFLRTINCYPEVLESEIDDCMSEARLPHAKKRTPISVPSRKSADSTSLEKQASREILADRVQNSIENLRLFCDQLCNAVGLEGHHDRYGDSEGSVPNSQVSNRDHQLGSENHIFAVGSLSSNEGSWRQWMSQITQESFAAHSPQEGVDSKYSGDLKDLLSSLQFLLFVLKNHQENEKISRAKLQALRDQKEALRLEKQQYYKDKYERRHHVADHQCLSSVSEESEFMAN